MDPHHLCVASFFEEAGSTTCGFTFVGTPVGMPVEELQLAIPGSTTPALYIQLP